MLRLLALVMVVLVAGCASSTGHPTAKRSAASPSASPSVAPITPSPTPSGAAGNLPVSTVAFSCRLPVVTYTTGNETVSYQGGFIDFPAGSYSRDPDGVVNQVNGSFTTNKAPILTGGFSPPSFDTSAGRWVPSPTAQMSPDGSTYAYATPGDAGAALIHVVNVGRDTEKVYRVAAAKTPAVGVVVEADDASGVFLADNVVEGVPSGVRRLDLATGTVTVMAQVANVLAVQDGNAWIGAVDPHDPTPPNGGAIGPTFDTIEAVNLTSHATTNWYYTQARADYLLGLASGGRPIVAVSAGPNFGVTGDTTEVRLIDHPNTSAEDNGELVSAPGLNLAAPQADGDRTWFSGVGGIYLYTSAGGLQRVFAGGDNPKAGGAISPAGLCR